MWRLVAPYRQLANFCGSLVASETADGEGAGGAYAVRPRLTKPEVAEMEPLLSLPPPLPDDAGSPRFLRDRRSNRPRSDPQRLAHRR